MNKEFIPYEQALELKELGFDEPCFGFYLKNQLELNIGFIKNDRIYNENSNGDSLVGYGKSLIYAPTYSQAFRWFRDKKLSDASVNRHGEADGGYSYRWDIVHEYGVYEERHFKQGYKTYEEAELACLIELIEIVKNK